jgi:type II secretory pathway predicted ATPase ExeA
MKKTLDALGIGVREFARAVGLSHRTARRLLDDGNWPKRDPEARGRVEAFLNAKMQDAGWVVGKDEFGGFAPRLPHLPAANEVGSACNEDTPIPMDEPGAAKPNPESAASTLFSKEQQMLIQKSTLTQAAREWWGIPQGALEAPWRREQVFLGGDMRVAYEHMLAKARFGGLLAIIGESGSGKTTIKDLLATDLAESGDVVVIEPHTQKMEENDKAGKTLKGGDLVEAIMREVAPAAKPKRTSEAQLHQVAACLAESLAENRDRRHLLIIDEAHCLPKPTLRHLKRFLEMKNPKIKGLQKPMLSIILLGQPELGDRLSPYDQSVREVWQRCEIARLSPIGKDLAGYLAHRLGRAAEAFAPEALVKLAEILTARDGTSFLYPRAIDSWLAEIMNAGVGLGKTVTAHHVVEAQKLVEKKNRGKP